MSLSKIILSIYFSSCFDHLFSYHLVKQDEDFSNQIFNKITEYNLLDAKLEKHAHSFLRN